MFNIDSKVKSSVQAIIQINDHKAHSWKFWHEKTCSVLRTMPCVHRLDLWPYRNKIVPLNTFTAEMFCFENISCSSSSSSVESLPRSPFGVLLSPLLTLSVMTATGREACTAITVTRATYRSFFLFASVLQLNWFYITGPP